jgi:hypothetical protein
MFGGADGGHAEPAQVQAGAQQLQQAKHPCADAATQFAECMSKNGGDMGACDFFYNTMQQCKMQNPWMLMLCWDLQVLIAPFALWAQSRLVGCDLALATSVCSTSLVCIHSGVQLMRL